MEPIQGLVLRTALLASQTETVGELPGNRGRKIQSSDVQDRTRDDAATRGTAHIFQKTRHGSQIAERTVSRMFDSLMKKAHQRFEPR